MMSISTIESDGVSLMMEIASAPVVAVSTFMPRRSSALDSAKMLRGSSSTSRTVRPTRSSSEELSRCSICCFSGGRSVIMRCKNSAVSSSSRSGDSTPLTTMLRVLFGRQFAAGKNNDRDFGKRAVGAHPFEHFEARHVRQAQIQHDAIAWSLAQRGQRLAAGLDVDDLDIVVTKQFVDAHLLDGIVLDHQEAPLARLGEFLDARERFLDALPRGRLIDEGKGAAGEPVLPVLVERDDLHRNVPRQRVLLELAQHVPAEHVGQEHVEG